MHVTRPSGQSDEFDAPSTDAFQKAWLRRSGSRNGSRKSSINCGCTSRMSSEIDPNRVVIARGNTAQDAASAAPRAVRGND